MSDTYLDPDDENNNLTQVVMLLVRFVPEPSGHRLAANRVT